MEETVINILICLVIMLKIFTKQYIQATVISAVYIMTHLYFRKGGIGVEVLGVGVGTEGFKNIDYKLNKLQEKMYLYTNDLVKSYGSKPVLKIKYIKLDSMYMDSRLISFLYSIISLYSYNPRDFYTLVKTTNSILKIHNEIEVFYNANNEIVENIHEMYDIMVSLESLALNTLHNFIYSVPKHKQMHNYITSSVEIYQKLVALHISSVEKYSKKYINTKGINTRTKFISVKSPSTYNPKDTLNFYTPLV